jgi:hypothetical protein
LKRDRKLKIFHEIIYYSNPILLVEKIPLLFRKQGKGNREWVRVLKVLFTF